MGFYVIIIIFYHIDYFFKALVYIKHCTYYQFVFIRVLDFARLFATKLGIKEEELEKSLWGNNFYSAKTKTILTGAQEKAKKPLFVQIVLENLWQIYDAIVIHKDQEQIEKVEYLTICKKLHANIIFFSHLQLRRSSKIYGLRYRLVR